MGGSVWLRCAESRTADSDAHQERRHYKHAGPPAEGKLVIWASMVPSAPPEYLDEEGYLRDLGHEMEESWD